jgi:hypothetical protein
MATALWQQMQTVVYSMMDKPLREHLHMRE